MFSFDKVHISVCTFELQLILWSETCHQYTLYCACICFYSCMISLLLFILLHFSLISQLPLYFYCQSCFPHCQPMTNQKNLIFLVLYIHKKPFYFIFSHIFRQCIVYIAFIYIQIYHVWLTMPNIC